LWCNIDKWGVMRGTKDLPIRDESGNITIMDMPKWKYCLKPHWDLNPWCHVRNLARGEPEMYQGLVALVDCPEEVGSFCTVPGSAKFLPTYIKEHKPPHNRMATIRVPEDDIILKYQQHVPLRKGEMVIWNSAQVHCNFMNDSNRMRLIQFIRYLPATPLCQARDRFAPKRIVKQYLKKQDVFAGIQLTELGRKLCALDPWE